MGSSEYSLNFCHNVRFLRKKHGLTQKKMADILGISVSKLRRIEKDDPTVRLNDVILRRFCGHFHVTADSALLERLDMLE